MERALGVPVRPGVLLLPEPVLRPAERALAHARPHRVEGWINLYGYCAGGPVGSADPAGENAFVVGLVGSDYFRGGYPITFPRVPLPGRLPSPRLPGFSPGLLGPLGLVGCAAALIVLSGPASSEPGTNSGGGGGNADFGLEPSYNPYPSINSHRQTRESERRELLYRSKVWDRFASATTLEECLDSADAARIWLSDAFSIGEINPAEYGSLSRQISDALSACIERTRRG